MTLKALPPSLDEIQVCSHLSCERIAKPVRWLCFSLLVALCLAPLAMAQVSVLTNHNDAGRTGQNLQETTLATTNVNVGNFGKVFTRTVDGYIYAQPLVATGLSIGSKGNVVYVATEHNSVYAFDADDPTASAPLWHVTPATLGTSVPSGDVCIGLSIAECPYKDLLPEIGITATPVIDPASSTIYVVAKSKNTSNNTYHFKLHALDLITGAEKFGGPVEITASVSGTGSGSSGGTITFKPLNQMNRPGLLLLNGKVYVGFGSVGDVPPWHGWIFGYSASNLLTAPTVFIATPNGDSGGFWAAGQGLAGNIVNSTAWIYGATSNGLFDVNTGGKDYGDSILKLNASSGLTVADYFTPHDQSFLDTGNVDLGSGGPMLLPNTTDLVNIGKDGYLRLMDTTTGKMGGFNSTTDQNLQNLLVTNGTNSFAFMGSPVYWNSPNNGPVIYFWGPDDFLKAYKFVNGLFQTTAVSQGTIQGTAGYSNSMPLSLSASGSQSGTGIVWATAPLGDASEQTVTGIVRAFDATDLGNELWDSNQSPARDALGNYAKFTPPTIANGKVYVPTFSNALVVYGLNPPPVSSITFMQVAAATPQSNSATVPVGPLPQAEIAGDLNIVVVGWNDTTSSVSSVTDTLGNTYTLAVGPTTASGARQSIYYAKNIKGGTNTVTVNFNQPAVYPDIRVLEYAGADTTNPLDVTAAAVGSSATASSGPATTTAAKDLIFGADTIATGTPGPGAGFTTRIITTHDSDLAEDEIGPSPGSYTATAPLSPSGYWVMQMAAFKVQGSGSGTPTPTVSSVSPASGSTNGGTGVTITGTNFSAGATVTFGGTAATSVTVVSGASITATTPAHAAGAVTVAVTNTGGQSGTLPNGFTYVSPTPTVSSVSPNSGSTNGGTSVTITGTNFAAGATVTFGGTAASSVSVRSSTSIIATTPAHAAGAVNVVVTNTGGPSATLTNGFNYTTSSGTPITFVQVAAATPQGSFATLSVPYTSSQKAGNLNMVVVGWNDTTSAVSSVTDSLGNSYILAVGPTTASGARQSIYYAKNIKGGSNTVTVTFSQAAAYPDIRILEYSGASTTSPVDVAAAAVGSSTTASCGPVTTTAANELIFAADTIATGTPGPGSGFTARIITTHDSDLAEDKQGATTGSYSATAPVSPAGYWVIQMVTIKQ
ncbi:MAG TPA: IPT/TIG domain-containing protein [Terriglobia bacterium]|nr:IPT/TIG domain-containing protein [Terriglobia bacterium]